MIKFDDDVDYYKFYLGECEKENVKLVGELEAASRYIEENEVVHKRIKKDVPTVIIYRGRRYILDAHNQ